VKRRSLVVALATLVAGVGVGIASATLTSTGSGTGIASTASMTNLSLLSTPGTPTTPLLPGGTGDVTFEVSNPNDAAVTITAVSPNGSITPSGGSGCTSSNDGVSFTAQTGLSIIVPAHAVAQLVDLPTSVSMTSGSFNGCQGASFSIPISVTGEQG
jgi:hypothetical protein